MLQSLQHGLTSANNTQIFENYFLRGARGKKTSTGWEKRMDANTVNGNGMLQALNSFDERNSDNDDSDSDTADENDMDDD